MAIPMDSELQAILMEVAEKSPTGGMFAGLAPKSIQGAFALPDSPVSVAQAGLSSAERHLITVYRGELSWVLQQAFHANHYAMPQDTHKSVIFQKPHSLNSLAKHALQRAHNCPAEALRYRTGHFLGKIAEATPITDRDELASLLVASLRLTDTTTARHYYGINSLACGDNVAAKSAIGPLLDQSSPNVSCYAFGMWRQVLDSEGQDFRAMRAGALAVKLSIKAKVESVCRIEAGNLLLANVQAGIARLSDEFWPQGTPVDSAFLSSCVIVDKRVHSGNLSSDQGEEMKSTAARLLGLSI